MSDAQSIAQIQIAVANRFGFTVDQLRSRSRKSNVVWARHVAMWLAREKTRRSFPAIGRTFGNRDHSTVMHACERMNRVALNDPAFGAEMRALAP